MYKWQIGLYCVAVLLWPSEHARFGSQRSLLPGKGVLNAIPEILGHPTTEPSVKILKLTTEKTSKTVKPNQRNNSPEAPNHIDHPPDDQNYPPDSQSHRPNYPLNGTSLVVDSNYPPDYPEGPSYPLDSPNTDWPTYPTDGPHYPPDTSTHPEHNVVQYAGLPRQLAVVPLPLDDSDHELKFNVSWQSGLGPPARDYSLEIRSVTDTVDCHSPMCYDYNIPGDTFSWTIPVYSSPVAETCAVRPGCAYRVRLIAHPWDGHTAANLYVELDECVAGVCSCGHAPRLPAPQVHAQTVTVQEEMFANITWSLPRPTYPQRLPPGLYKKNYVVSIGKQMVSNAHPSPWFANTITRQVDSDGPVADGDELHWLLLPIDERSERRDKRIRKPALDVRLIARVSLIDDRGCFGPAGNATVYDPAENAKVSIGTYILWAVFGGACVLAMGAVAAVSTRVVKRILHVFRPPGSTAPLDPLRRRPAWFPLQIRRI
ncbi:hypothetical protein O3G_MSEX001372 [Manduca sexta]|uniref:Uncharacterized protein n=1 Tax=Manduca sexta TaxID=7130 RepID=A0A921YJW6_MANSE|nr:hypothetical protein O3G_MSEX001372 [Manduca sexta]